MKTLNRIIELSFYSLFFFVPLIFFGNTSELFEFNKMWLAFGLTIIIAAAWIIKMILQRRIHIQKTPLDIPILLFFASQFIATIVSIDPHVSWWGYYSRFNGGLFSTISYILLYYAFVSNLSLKHVMRSFQITLASGFIVALWGFPAHFGYDPTCLVFRGTLDTTCWTEAFKPTIRIFSTLGQPAWLAAYLTFLLPLSMAFALNNTKSSPRFWSYVGLTALLFLCLIFANTRAAFIAFLVADIVFWAAIYLKKLFSFKKYATYFLIFNAIFVACSFFPGSPIGGLFNKFFSLQELVSAAVPKVMAQEPTASAAGQTQTNQANKIIITDSGDIRLNVWKGAIDTWKANPVFGTGVETFAFAYYKYKPAEHNLTSEWDFLYNKAHNEYLNYLATTGAVGLGTHLLMLGWFLFLTIKYIITTKKSDSPHLVLLIALVTGYVSIIITNFFNFSVVIMNIFLFLTPAFVFILTDMLNPNKKLSIPSGSSGSSKNISAYQWTAIIAVIIIALFLILRLFWYWYADVAYALGKNLDGVGQYQQAYPKLMEAVTTEPNEPLYKDELAINLAVLSTALYAQKDTQNGSQFAQNAVTLSNEVVTRHPNNVVYWKSRVRVFYTLAESTPENQQQYMMEAVKAIDEAAKLAPNDAKIAYNQGVLHGQIGEVDKGIALLERTIAIKPDYKDAYYALGLFYRQLAVDKDNNVVNAPLQKKAVETMEYILKIEPNDKLAKDALNEWQK